MESDRDQDDVRSVTSNITRNSQGSVKSAASDSVMMKKAKLASLRAQQSFAEKEAAVAEKEAALARENKQLQLERETAITLAELAIFEQYADEEGRQFNTVPSMISADNRPPISSMNFANVCSVPEFVPASYSLQNPVSYSLQNPAYVQSSFSHCTSVYNNNANRVLSSPNVPQSTQAVGVNACSVDDNGRGTMNQDCIAFLPSTTDIMLQVLRESQLPKIELTTFSGDPMEFLQWMASFERLIEDSTPDPAKRLHYLSQFTSGSAKLLVSGYVMDHSAAGYECAKGELMKEYGQPNVIARAYLKKIENWKPIPLNDVSALKSFSIFLKSCKGSMTSLTHLQQLNTDLYLQRIVSKLAAPLQVSWRKYVHSLERNSCVVSFHELVNFIEGEASVSSHPVFSAQALHDSSVTMAGMNPSSMRTQRYVKTVAATACEENPTTATPRRKPSTSTAVSSSTNSSRCACPKCEASHDLDDCSTFLGLSVEDRHKFVKSKGLCFGCYGHTSRSHNVKNCRRRKKCMKCGRMHPTSLHGFQVKPAEAATCSSDETQAKVLACNTKCSISPVLLNVVMVRLYHEGNEVVVYAALDSLSSGCFMSRELWELIGCPGEPAEITVKTVCEENVLSTSVVKSLSVSSLAGDQVIPLPKVYVQDSLPLNSDDIVSHDVLRSYSYLKDLLDDMPDRDESIPIGLLIGANCSKALEPVSCIPAPASGGPSAVKTILGWSVSGPVAGNPQSIDSERRLLCNLTSVGERSVEVRESGLFYMLKCMYEDDYIESTCDKVKVDKNFEDLPSEKALSQDDKRFISKMKAEAEFVDGHYELPLPVKPDIELLPDNRGVALQRLSSLKKRFSFDESYRVDYSGFIQDLLRKGYAKRSHDSGGRVWYVPHHGVYHPKKPDKIRVVFDCSSQHNGVSLNKFLLQGPDLTNSLVGVLIRFRQERVAVMADIEAMFHQVKVPENYQDYLRFLWWPDGDTSLEPQDYQMTVHLFGATSSPSCANFALRRTAVDNKDRFGEDACSTLQRNFYVDDMLKSVEDEVTATDLVPRVTAMCHAGGFHLTKFVSNSRYVLDSVPVCDRSKGVTNIDLSHDVLPIERALGVTWLVENDKLSFRIILKDSPLTRRGILSTVSSIYDPLGLAGPFLLKGKRLLQQLCLSKLDWDDQVDDQTRAVWEKWRASLPSLESIELDRCFKPDDFGDVNSITLHHFSDASKTGIGQCSYIRLVDCDGRVHCSLVMGRSRVSPAKPMTVPRLELTAAAASVKIGQVVERELDYSSVDSYFWTDSIVVLGYIRNEARRFHTFVANRVQLIHDHSSVSSWRYVSTDHNPADDASRGIDCDKIDNQHRWFRGPEFLWQSTSVKSDEEKDFRVDELDPEVNKKMSVCTTTVAESDDLMSRYFRYHSSWHQLKKNVAWLLVVFRQLRNSLHGEELRDMKQSLTVQEIQNAEVAIHKSVQAASFKEELKAIRHSVDIKSSSSLIQLNPVLNSDGLLCVGGRLKHSSVPDYTKHQVILPKMHPVVKLIVQFYHELSGHSGREHVAAMTRQRYWIIGVKQAARFVKKQCFTCRRMYSKPVSQQMADLPFDRTAMNQPPFSYVGVDFFGPFMVKIGRSEVKRYGCLFTCLTIRAVHIEVAHSLDTDSFINCLQRFISRRGTPIMVRSDNGTNFVGAERELRQSIKQWNKSKIEGYLQQREIEWRFNVPAASHMGGVWERQIRTVRKLLLALAGQQRVNEETLHTLMCVVENVINSRPITPVSDDPADLEALSPNHLLYLRPGPRVPPGEFVKQDLYVRRRWRQVQYLADLFWSRWRREYLPSLQCRTKWQRKMRNVAVNDFVLIADDNLPRSCWLYGRITQIFPGADGLTRSVEVKTKNGLFKRPVSKLCLLESSHEDYA